MESPLQYDMQLAKDLGLKGELEPSVDAKIAYVDSQIDQLKQMILRYRYDLLLTENLINSSNELMEAKGRENKAQFMNDIRQGVIGCETMIQLRKELKALKNK